MAFEAIGVAALFLTDLAVVFELLKALGFNLFSNVFDRTSSGFRHGADADANGLVDWILEE